LFNVEWFDNVVCVRAGEFQQRRDFASASSHSLAGMIAINVIMFLLTNSIFVCECNIGHIYFGIPAES